MSEFGAMKETTQQFISQEWDLQLIFIFKNNMLRFVLKSLSQFWTVPGLAMQKKLRLINGEIQTFEKIKYVTRNSQNHYNL